jgi:hypothetical protein
MVNPKGVSSKEPPSQRLLNSLKVIPDEPEWQLKRDQILDALDEPLIPSEIFHLWMIFWDVWQLEQNSFVGDIRHYCYITGYNLDHQELNALLIMKRTANAVYQEIKE